MRQGYRGVGVMSIGEGAFLELIEQNHVLSEIIGRGGELDLPDAWLAGGCLFQTAWNVLAGRDPVESIKDYDLFYFDGERTSGEAEAEANGRAARLFGSLGCEVEVCNQARVHEWYAEAFGMTGYPRLTKTTDGIDRFLATCCMVAVRISPDARREVYAPLGLDDLLSLVMRPNPWFPDAPSDAFARKAARWSATWPMLKVDR
jgi:uncharacterized protein